MADGTQITGLGSGIDWATTIDQLMEIEKRPVYMKKARISDLDRKNSAWASIKSQMAALQSTLESMDEEDELMLKTATSSNSAVLTVSANENASSGIFDIKINQLANGYKSISQGFASTSDTVFSSDGTFTYYGESGSSEEITLNVTTSTTLADLKRMINSENDSDFTASIMNDGDDTNPYRLILTSKSTGKDSAITTGGTATFNSELRDVAIGDATSASTNDGTSTSMNSFGSVYTGSQDAYTFTVTTVGGGTVGSGTLQLEVKNSAGDTVKTIDVGSGYTAGNKIDIENGVQISFDAGTLAEDDGFTVNTTDATARDAQIVVENLIINKSSNSISDVIEGVTLNLQNVTSGSDTVSVQVEDNKSGVKSKINSFISQYNTILTALDGYQKWDDEKKEGGPLFGDGAVSSIKSSMGMLIGAISDGLDDTQTYKTLSQVGIEMGAGGKLSMDSTKFDDALDDNFTEVIKLFTRNADISGTNHDKLTYMTSTHNTKGGEYAITANVDGDGNVVSGTINGVAATINNGFLVGADGDDCEGIMINVDTSDPATHGTTLSGSIKFATGKNVELINAMEGYIKDGDEDSNKGTIQIMTEGIAGSIKNLNEEIDSLNLRLAKKRDILEKQWLRMESAITKMRGQSSTNDAMMG